MDELDEHRTTTHYEVPPGGGFFVDVPGIWQGGEVLEVDDQTREVTVLCGPKDEQSADIRTQPASSGPAR